MITRLQKLAGINELEINKPIVLSIQYIRELFNRVSHHSFKNKPMLMKWINQSLSFKPWLETLPKNELNKVYKELKEIAEEYDVDI